MELSVALTSEIFKYDPVAKNIREKVYRNNLDPLLTYFIDHWYGKHSNTSPTIKTTSGSNVGTGPTIYGYGNETGDQYQGNVGDTTRGVVVGSGSGAPSFSDYALGNKIAHGTGSGQLYYYQSTLVSYQFTSSPKKYQNVWQRQIANKSGADITVSEMGYYVYMNSTYIYMLCRDVISGGVNLLNNGYYLFQFILEIGP
jgi:hypothetical protein